jgi:glycerophosphoryl diester phosphodiesterase
MGNCPSRVAVLSLWYDVFFWKGAACMGKRLTLIVFLVPLFLLLSGFTLVGHRGDPLNYPEETFQSFDSAFNNGADYVELDVHESADGVIVIQHDTTIQRTTGATWRSRKQTSHNFSNIIPKMANRFTA